jgi:hypothetical protein
MKTDAKRMLVRMVVDNSNRRDKSPMPEIVKNPMTMASILVANKVNWDVGFR